MDGSESKHFIEFPSDDHTDEDEEDILYDPKDKNFSPAEPDKMTEPKPKRRRIGGKKPILPPSPSKPISNKTEDVLQSGVVAQVKKEFECCVCHEILYDTRQCANANSSSSSSSTAPPKGHNICGICWTRMLPLPSTHEGSPQCPICKYHGGVWTSNASLDNVIELMYPQEVKARKDVGWISLPYALLCKEIPRRMDKNFAIMSNVGEYSSFLNNIVEIAQEAQKTKYISDPRADEKLTDKLYKAVQRPPSGNRRHPQRYFRCSVSRVGTHRFSSHLSFSCFGLSGNDHLIVRLLDHYWWVVEADRILE